jgi:hypothetical protein
MKYLLTKKQTDLLIGISNDIIILTKLKEAQNFISSRIENSSTLDLNEEEIEKILDELTTAFVSKGVDQTYEPNEYGLQIERLIDIFSND